MHSPLLIHPQWIGGVNPSPEIVFLSTLREHSHREALHLAGPNQVEAMDVMADQLVDDCRFQSMTVVDICRLTFVEW